jgi:hypothetical protein
MKFTNPFKKKQIALKGVAPTADALIESAWHFANDVAEKSTPEQLRVFELAAKNGSLVLEIQVLPERSITMKLNPGNPTAYTFKSTNPAPMP